MIKLSTCTLWNIKSFLKSHLKIIFNNMGNGPDILKKRKYSMTPILKMYKNTKKKVGEKYSDMLNELHLNLNSSTLTYVYNEYII